MKNALLTVSALFALSCSKQNEKLVIDSSKDSISQLADEQNFTDSTLVTKTQCYIADLNGDSVFVSIDDNLGTVNGRMFYKYRMKDRTYGDLIGTSSGDTIKADYMFESEGRPSTREIWFLKKDGKLQEATGKYDASGEKYADTKNLTFGESFNYKAADCKTVEKALNSVAVKAAQTETPAATPIPAEKPKEERKPIKEPAKTEKKTEEKKTETKKATSTPSKTAEKPKGTTSAKKIAEPKKASTSTSKKTTETKKEIARK